MRIVVTGINEKVTGGVESYLRQLIPLLRQAGDDVVYAHQQPGGPGPPVDPMSLHRLGESPVRDLERLRPDLVFQNGLLRPKDELEVGRSGLPVVFFSHAYSGFCVSGTRRFSRPAPKVCTRPLGPGCWVHYFQQGCGGLNPLTAVELYSQNARRLEAMREVGRLVVASEHMRAVALAHGISEARIRKVPLFVSPSSPRSSPGERYEHRELLFLGRITRLKGWPELLDAFARFSPGEGRWTLRVVGEGPDRAALERRARELAVRVDIQPWMDENQRDSALDRATLLVMPSTWPEPFGIVGLEAARLGVPTVTFGTGGISEWLVPGVTGMVAPRVTGEALAEAIGWAVSSAERYRSLSGQALQRAADFGPERHLRELRAVFDSVAHPGASTAAEGRA